MLLLIIFILIISSTSFAQTTPHWQQSHYIENSFYDIALNNEYDNKQTKIRKWTQPLKIFIDHQVGDSDLHLRILKMHLSHLNKITHLPVEYVKIKKQANLKIFITQ